MKVFHKENGKEVVYVQRTDIIYLATQRNKEIVLHNICQKMSEGINVVTDTTRLEFVRFDNENEVKFFRECEFICDFDQYKDFTDEQIVAEVQRLAVKVNEIAKKWNEMTLKERSENISLNDMYHDLGHMIIDLLSEINAAIHGEREMPFLKE